MLVVGFPFLGPRSADKGRGLLGFPCHGSGPKRVAVRGDHRKGQEATAGHKPLDRLAPAVVWRDPV